MATSMPSEMICLAAMLIAIIPDEHCLSIVCPATESGRPASKRHCLAVLKALEPICKAAPITTSSTSPGSTLALSTACLMAWAPKACPEVLLNAPRYAFPIGVLAVETITASLISYPFFVIFVYAAAKLDKR